MNLSFVTLGESFSSLLVPLTKKQLVLLKESIEAGSTQEPTK
jgi:hypothetical protein